MTKEQIKQLAEDIYDHYPDFGNGERALMEKSDVLAALCEMFEAGAAADSPLLRWVKASQPPKSEESVNLRFLNGIGYDEEWVREVGYYENGKWYWWNDTEVPTSILENLEWLEEAPASQAIPETNDKDLIAIASNLSTHTVRQVIEKEEGELQPCCINSCDGFKCESGSVHLIASQSKEEGEAQVKQEIESAIRGLEKGLEWIEPIRQKMGGVGRIKFVMKHALSVLQGLKEEGDDVASDNNSNEASVASHTASSGNSTQQEESRPLFFIRKNETKTIVAVYEIEPDEHRKGWMRGKVVDVGRDEKTFNGADWGISADHVFNSGLYDYSKDGSF